MDLDGYSQEQVFYEGDIYFKYIFSWMEHF